MRHDLPTYTSALAFRVLVSLVPLALLAFGLLGALGLEGVWRDELRPTVEDRVTQPVYRAIDDSVERIFRTSSVGLIAFAGALLLWELTRALRTIMKALNVIHASKEGRSARKLALVAVGLSVVIAVAVLGSMLAVAVLPRLVDGGASVAATVAAWLITAVLLGTAATLVIRYAPAEHPEPRWASRGSALIVATWVVASLAFGWWATSVANYESAAGTLLVFLLLTAYVLVTSGIFLVGVELDELARNSTRRR